MSDWRDEAKCREVDPALFFAEEGETQTTRKARLTVAKAICARCDVINECDEYAKTMNISYGVWGGKSEKERQRGDIELGCRWCSHRFVWVWQPVGRPWYCSDSCRRAAQKQAHKERNQKYQQTGPMGLEMSHPSGKMRGATVAAAAPLAERQSGLPMAAENTTQARP